MKGQPFDIKGKVAVVTGGAGVLCSAICLAIAEEGAKVAILDLDSAAAARQAASICAEGGEAIGIRCDMLRKADIEAAAQEVLSTFQQADILINGAGGNRPQATTSPDKSFFDLPREAIQWVFDLNCMGTILACQVFGKIMARQKSGIIINISSMNAFRPLTNVPAYSAAKAAVSNFTQWLAVHMAQEYSPEIRVNAIAPGFFLTGQNRSLLTDPGSGELTARGRAILSHTPMGRFGSPEDLVGAILWLASPASAFVTGIILPVDGGFSAYSGV